MRDNIIPMHGEREHAGDKHTRIFLEFVNRYLDQFQEDGYHQSIVDFCAHGWNIGTLRQHLTTAAFEQGTGIEDLEGWEGELIRQMIEDKKNYFGKHDFMIQTAWTENINGEQRVMVTVTDRESFLKEMIDNAMDEMEDVSFPSGFINRNALIIKPLQPMIDWINSLDPDNPVDNIGTKILLIDDDAGDPEKFIKQNYKAMFEDELQGWYIEESMWPKKRTYKMFRNWVQVEVCTYIYDIGNEPLLHDEELF